MANLFGTLRQLQQIILDLLYPPSCVSCHQAGAWLCLPCVGKIERFSAPCCIKCDLPLAISSSSTLCQRCEREPMPYLDGLRTVSAHQSPLREAIHALKYDKHQEVALRLGWLLAECWRERGGFQIDGLLAVPLHPEREQERGFNQSERLATAMSEHLGIPLYDNILMRIRNTSSQVGLSGQERIQNMSEAFLASPQAANKRWLLVDDVSTTGSTLIACAYALRTQGAQAVWAITLTRPIYDDNRQPKPEHAVAQRASSQRTVWQWDN